MAPTQRPFTLVRPRGVWSCHAARDVLWPGVGTVSQSPVPQAWRAGQEGQQG